MPLLQGLGAFLRFRRDPVAFLESMAAQGPRGEAQLGPRRIILLSDPQEVGALLVHHGQRCIKAGALARAKPLLGEALITMEGPGHLQRRKAVQPTFHGDRLAPLAWPVLRRTLKLIEAWQGQSEVSAKEAMVDLTFGVAAEVLLGEALDEELPELEAAMQDLQGAFPTLLWPASHLLLRLPLPRHLRARRGIARFQRTAQAVIAKRRAAGAQGSCLLDGLIRGLGEGEAAEAALQAEAMSMMTAGHDTTATALTWVLRRVGEDPACLEALRAEAKAIAPDGPEALAERVGDLALSRRVVAECLRLHPPGWLIVRQPSEELPLPLGPLPAGCLVMVSPHVLHRDPAHWPEPERFDPDRHLPEAQAERARFSYLPFGAGMRACVGEPLAWLEATLVLATLAWHLRWEAVGPRPRGEAGVTLAPQGPVPIRLRP